MALRAALIICLEIVPAANLESTSQRTDQIERFNNFQSPRWKKISNWKNSHWCESIIEKIPKIDMRVEIKLGKGRSQDSTFKGRKWLHTKWADRQKWGTDYGLQSIFSSIGQTQKIWVENDDQIW